MVIKKKGAQSKTSKQSIKVLFKNKVFREIEQPRARVKNGESYIKLNIFRPL